MVPGNYDSFMADLNKATKGDYQFRILGQDDAVREHVLSSACLLWLCPACLRPSVHCVARPRARMRTPRARKESKKRVAARKGVAVEREKNRSGRLLAFAQPFFVAWFFFSCLAVARDTVYGRLSKI